jgi:hypothetical protein
VVLRDPALIVCLLGLSASGHSRSICTNDRDLVLWSNSLLGATRGTLGTLSTLPATSGLWEESLNPGLVNEIEGSSKCGEEEEVQEDAAS